MIVFPNGKINLGLHIHRKRDDGYHDIESCLYPVPVNDALEIIQFPEKNSRPEFSFTLSGREIEGKKEENLCHRAFLLLKKDFPHLPPAHLHLHKAIPSGAGLGGGSADGAFTLALLNRLFLLGLSEEKLIEYSLQLGSDCPFFIINKPCIATGRGEMLEPVPLLLSRFKILLVYPGIPIPTRWAFDRIQPGQHAKQIIEIVLGPAESWKEELSNDFEKPVFEKYPEIKKIKEDLYRYGAIYSSLSGTGSTVFGIFNKDSNVTPEFPAHFFVKELPGEF